MSINSPYPVGPLGVYLENLFDRASQLETDVDELEGLLEDGEVERAMQQKAKASELSAEVRSGLDQAKEEVEVLVRSLGEFFGSIHELLGKAD